MDSEWVRQIVSQGKPWSKAMKLATDACLAYRALKAGGGATRHALETSKLAARSAISDFIVQNHALYYTDKEFKKVSFPLFRPGGDTVDKSSEFIKACYPDVPELRGPWGHMLEKISNAPHCVNHGDKISEFEGRCFPSGIGNALDALQWSGEIAEMERLYADSQKVVDSKGQPALRWPNVMMRPMVTFTGIRQLPVWDRGDDPSVAAVMDLLEKNAAVFKADLQALRRGGYFGPAYDHLLGAGRWSKVSLFVDGSWNEKLCAAAQGTCRLLRDQLPGRRRQVPYTVPNHEEVVFFHSSPGSHVMPHNGGQNGRINVHLGLEGFEGSRLVVHTGINQTQTLSWSDSKAIAFNDGWIHEVVNGENDDRYVLALGIMHPDIREGSYAECFTGKTMAYKLHPDRMERIRRDAALMAAEPRMVPGTETVRAAISSPLGVGLIAGAPLVMLLACLGKRYREAAQREATRKDKKKKKDR